MGALHTLSQVSTHDHYLGYKRSCYSHFTDKETKERKKLIKGYTISSRFVFWLEVETVTRIWVKVTNLGCSRNISRVMEKIDTANKGFDIKPVGYQRVTLQGNSGKQCWIYASPFPKVREQECIFIPTSVHRWLKMGVVQSECEFLSFGRALARVLEKAPRYRDPDTGSGKPAGLHWSDESLIISAGNKRCLLHTLSCRARVATFASA